LLRDNLQKKIIPEHLLNVTDSNLDGYISDEDAWLEFNNGSNFIGTGPYIFNNDYWSKGEEYTLHLRTNLENPYWPGELNDPANIPDIKWTQSDIFNITKVVTKILSSAEQIEQFEEGNIDIVDITDYEELYKEYDNSPLFKVYSAKSNKLKYIPINSYSIGTYVADEQVELRKALAYATNKELMIESIMGEKEVIWDNPISAANEYYYHTNNPIKYQYDIEEALHQMKEAGYDVYENVPETDQMEPVAVRNKTTGETEPTEENKTGIEWLIVIPVIIIGQAFRRRRR
jgi:ABC-type transport system substrate-binding protein